MLVYEIQPHLDMQRDLDLFRDLLLKFEANAEMDGTRQFMYAEPEEIGIHGRTCEEVAYHIRLLIEAGLVRGVITMGYRLHIISGLTNEGHDFLDNARNSGIWNKVKSRVADLPTASLKLIAALAEAEVMKHLGLK